MKPGHVLSALTALWVAFAALEGLSSCVRLMYGRKMHAAARAVSGAVNGLKATLMVILAVSNVMLFIRNMDE